mmetsp:Transcript_11524/g.22667  ORF Transcript_11524/g.22667 Transcript_11524/m.22667 type:complete len:510 (+) Transcript_11524:218-1747(+)|eukprot:CAMPEP_0171494916 /NCGR_PEP_ID=MMETSP0958-20121227/5827_1 /TAXON_ID=87120 /ORGANISM="Aurantiochytrium limacinum, Strain ATCCMYA-1381" /LENGTH=509 /DNA_ID=CAMNT_0012028791 /DNA_START=142 /DNA_END=1671 /DNA_ORIENTATION=-
MGKRRGDEAGIDLQVSKESYDASETGDYTPASRLPESGSSFGADSSTLKSRTIRTGVRRAPFGSSSSAAKPSGGLFAGVNLTAGLSSTSSSSNGGLFGSSSFSSSSNEESNPIKSSLTSLPEPTETKTKPLNFGSSNSSMPSFGSASSSKSSAPSGLFSSGSSASTLKNGASGNLGSSADSGASGKSEEYLKRMAALNKSFTRWVDTEMKKTEEKPLVDGVMEYLRYAAKEKSDEKARAGTGVKSSTSNGASSSSSGPAASSSSSGGGLFSNSSSSSSTFSSPFASSSSAEKKESTTSSGGLFGSTSSSNGGGLFGSSSSSSTTSKPFDFSGKSSAPSGLFGASSSGSTGGLFGSNAPAASNNGNNNENEDDGDGDTAAQEGETKVEDNIQDDEVQLMKTRAKVFYLKDGTWVSKGLGALSLLQEKDSKRAFIVLRSDAGRVTANIPVISSMQPTADKKSVRFVAVSYSEDSDGTPKAENEGKPVPFMLRVKTEEDAVELKTKIEETIA